MLWIAPKLEFHVSRPTIVEPSPPAPSTQPRASARDGTGRRATFAGADGDVRASTGGRVRRRFVAHDAPQADGHRGQPAERARGRRLAPFPIQQSAPLTTVEGRR